MRHTFIERMRSLNVLQNKTHRDNCYINMTGVHNSRAGNENNFYQYE